MNTLNWIFTGLIALLLIPYIIKVWKPIKKFLTTNKTQNKLEIEITQLRTDIRKLIAMQDKPKEPAKSTEKEEQRAVGAARDLDGRIGGNFNNPPKEKTKEEIKALQAEKYEKHGRDWYLSNRERILSKQRKTKLQKLRERPNHDKLSRLKAEYNEILDLCHPNKEDILEEVFTSIVGMKVSRHTPLGDGTTLHLIKKIEDLKQMNYKLLNSWKKKVEIRIYKRRYARAMPELKKMKKLIIKLKNEL